MPQRARVSLEREQQVRSLLKEGLTTQQVKARTLTSASTISRIRNGQLERSKMGRPPKVPEHVQDALDRVALKLAESSLRITSQSVWSRYKGKARNPVTPSQIGKVLRRKGWKWSKNPNHRPLLNASQRKARVKWCKKELRKPASLAVDKDTWHHDVSFICFPRQPDHRDRM
jgi:hypothetical protein